MNPEYKKSWIAALRSGDFVQGRSGYLCKDGSYCALGVLCEVLNARSGVSEFDSSVHLYGKTGRAVYLDEELLERVDMDHELQLWIAFMNSRKTFDEIATFIGRNL